MSTLRFNPQLFEENWTTVLRRSRLSLLVQSPTSLFAYWFIDPSRQSMITDHFQRLGSDGKWAMRLIHAPTGDVLSTWNIPPETRNWYIRDVHPVHRYSVELVTSTASGHPFLLLRSNLVETPSDANHRANGPFHTARLHEMTQWPSVEHSPGPSADAPTGTDLSYPYMHEFDGYSVLEGGRKP